ncbi:iron donor protein CyaY [Rickettsia endosymbiont of Cardiosporidium cionae]|uniref:iron donor protein CyaY n=1 Tax=Rickettsia endosymbiont of Cardiosporidium cionae TaxID=2777155 RepID=UPI001893BDF8|nr:iron donor protein CyaY [Rickettsia endosymbiont of Cardiosporidium cionae]KAF8818579.1 iron donor protein CyaY [Rickettsia endosymbiont of Cardiosporidium cionae]
MSQQEFLSFFHKLLHYINDRLDEHAISDNIEADVSNEVLTITIDDCKTFVINKQCSLKEIWVSSPFTGPYHFKLDTDSNLWKDSSNNELFSLITHEIGVTFNYREFLSMIE